MKLDQLDDFDDDLGIPLLDVPGQVDGRPHGKGSDDFEDATEVKNDKSENSSGLVIEQSESDFSDIRNQFDEGKLPYSQL